MWPFPYFKSVWLRLSSEGSTSLIGAPNLIPHSTAALSAVPKFLSSDKGNPPSPLEDDIVNPESKGVPWIPSLLFKFGLVLLEGNGMIGESGMILN